MAGQNMPAAEVDVDEQLVRRLLRDQKPELADATISQMAFGWDNVSFRIGVDLVARLPRRVLAAHLIANEARWLPQLAPRLPLPIPVPVFLGAPAHGYPWQWLIAPLIPGRPAPEADRLDYTACARQLGGFLAALHVPAPEDAPENPFRGEPLAERDGTTRERLAGLADVVDAGRLGKIWDETAGAPAHRGAPVWLHGDLHPANLLTEHGRLSGVVDFGDVTSGDPATDLAIAWSFLPPGTRELFWRSYGKGDEPALRSRARGWAVSLGAAYLAHSADNPTMARIGQRMLTAILVD
jgi:aminoglycoside phosphotransferase (APT) family kinase protein